jgi:hypothetical protein
MVRMKAALLASLLLRRQDRIVFGEGVSTAVLALGALLMMLPGQAAAHTKPCCCFWGC